VAAHGFRPRPGLLIAARAETTSTICARAEASRLGDGGSGRSRPIAETDDQASALPGARAVGWTQLLPERRGGGTRSFSTMSSPRSVIAWQAIPLTLAQRAGEAPNRGAQILNGWKDEIQQLPHAGRRPSSSRGRRSSRQLWAAFLPRSRGTRGSPAMTIPAAKRAHRGGGSHDC